MGVIHRRTEDEALGLPGLFHKGVHRVLQYAFSQFSTLSAGHAVRNGRVAQKQRLRLHSLFPQGAFHLRQRDSGAAPLPGTAVDQQYFHWPDLLFKNPSAAIISETAIGRKPAGRLWRASL